MRKSRFLILCVVLALCLLIVNRTQSSYLSNLNSLWFYGAPRSWGALGYDTEGKPIFTAEDSAKTFYEWSSKIEDLIGRKLDLHADLILYSDRGYNRLVEETAILILDKAKKDGLNVRISLNISVPSDWTVNNLRQEIDTIFSGSSGYLSLGFLKKYGDSIDFSIDFEPPVFYKSLHLEASQINKLYNQYVDNRTVWSTVTDATLLKMYVYNFGNMFAKPEELDERVIVIFNGVTDQKTALATMYKNEKQVAERPVGIMVFVLPHLGRGQRLGSFGKGDLKAVIDWMVTEDITAPILGFQ